MKNTAGCFEPPQPHETEIIGAWIRQDDKIIADDNQLRIEWLIHHFLEPVSADDWTALYKDPNDLRAWRLVFPNSDWHGGGPMTLVCEET